MKTFLFLIAFLLSFLSSIAEYKETRTRLYLFTKNGERFENLVFGIHPDATDYLDKNLGEQELFPGHPPSGLHGVFVIYDTSQNENVWSYLDLKHYPSSDTSFIYYRLETNFDSGDGLTISWMPLNDNIREAYINDIITGNLVTINMKDSLRASISNEFIKKFTIKILYGDPTSNVEEKTTDVYFDCYPNPFSDNISFKFSYPEIKYSIYSEIGELIISDKLDAGFHVLDFKNLQSGVYLLKIQTHNGIYLTKKIIKI